MDIEETELTELAQLVGQLGIGFKGKILYPELQSITSFTEAFQSAKMITRIDRKLPMTIMNLRRAMIAYGTKWSLVLLCVK